MAPSATRGALRPARVLLGCAFAILASGLVIAIVFAAGDRWAESVAAFFGAEAVAVSLFALSWAEMNNVLSDTRQQHVDARFEQMSTLLDAQLKTQFELRRLLASVESSLGSSDEDSDATPA